jgi:hypothetical protein
MQWISLIIAAIAVWALCGGVIGVGRRLWKLDTVLVVHLLLAPLISFCVSYLHSLAAPGFDPLTRASVIVAIVVLLDAGLVARVFEKSYAMFRSLIGTWIPFVLVFLASWAVGAFST